MASPAPAEVPNGTATASPTTTQPNTQSTTQPSSSQLSNGQPAPAAAASADVPPNRPRFSTEDTGDTKRPNDARLVHLILARAGVHSYSERVPLQIMDFAYRYTSGILSDAISYEPASHGPSTGSKRSAAAAAAAGGGEETVSLNAVRTAVAARAANTFQPTLPKDFLLELASERNKIALPRIEREFGIRLPPERYCFTGVGWDIQHAWEEEVDVEGDEEEEGVGGSGNGGNMVQGLGDTAMGGMEEEEVEEDEFEEVMGAGGRDAEMADA